MITFVSNRVVGNNGSFGRPYLHDLHQKYARAQSRGTLLDLSERLFQYLGLTRNDVLTGNF